MIIEIALTLTITTLRNIKILFQYFQILRKKFKEKNIMQRIKSDMVITIIDLLEKSL